jgi:hypothetical protein
MMNTAELFARALEYQRCGRWQSARDLCGRILDSDPNQIDALNLMGIVTLQAGQAPAAADYFQRAVGLKPESAAYHANLGAAYQAMGSLDVAVASYRRAIELKPDSPEVLKALADVLRSQGHAEKAMTYFRRSLEGPATLPPATTIPNVIHFCFGFDDQPPPFHYFHYLAVLTAWWVNRPDRIVLHYGNAPSGEWWERMQQYARLEHVEPPTEIFGRPLHHYAHKADVFRLELLLREGGIYLDLDVLCLRPFTGLLGRECVLAHQHPPDVGLCNAVILAAPQSRFLSAWYEEYRTFRSKGRDEHWVEHGVWLPREIARRPELQQTLKMLPSTAFFFPVWTEIDRFLVDGDVRPFQHSYCVHLWETINMNLLREITPDSIQRGESALAKLVKPMLADEVPMHRMSVRTSTASATNGSNLRTHFERILTTKSWGDGTGFGSDPKNVPHYIPFLQEMLRELEIRTVVEVGCGDWQVGRDIDWSGINYFGVDIVPELIERAASGCRRQNVRFICGDALSLDLLQADLLIAKDVLQHWTTEEILAFLPNIQRYRYALITNDVEAPELRPNWEIRWHPVDLTKPPYCLLGRLRLVQYIQPFPPKASYLFKGDTFRASVV